jgi:hypothetical protein
VLGQTREAYPLLAISLPDETGVDGILGLDFLRGQRLTLDFRLGILTLD